MENTDISNASRYIMKKVVIHTLTLCMRYKKIYLLLFGTEQN